LEITNGFKKTECLSLQSISTLYKCNTLAYRAHSKASKKTNCFEQSPAFMNDAIKFVRIKVSTKISLTPPPSAGPRMKGEMFLIGLIVFEFH
jgi:hypothetical protein